MERKKKKKKSRGIEGLDKNLRKVDGEDPGLSFLVENHYFVLGF